MTLPASGAISTDQIMAELRVANPGRAYPLGMFDADVLALIGKSGPPVILPTDFYGKSSYTPMSGSVPNVSGTSAVNPSANYTKQLTVSVSVSGGRAPLSFAWVHVSGDGSVAAANAASTTADFQVSRFDTAGTVYSQVVQCTVTDATGATLVRQGTVTLTLT